MIRYADAASLKYYLTIRKTTQLMKRNKAVDEYLKKKSHPLTDEIQRVREIILNAY